MTTPLQEPSFEREGYVVGGVRLARPFSILRFGHFGLYQRDLAASVHFYRDLLGMRQTDVGPAGSDPATARVVFLTCGTDHHSFVLLDSEIGRARDDRYSRGVTLNQMSFQVETLQEVVDAHSFLRDRGAKIWRVGRDVPGSNWAVYALDPDGHPVELFYGMEQIGWNRLSKPPGLAPQPVLDAAALPQASEDSELRRAVDDGNSFARGFRSNDLDVTDLSPEGFDVGGVRMPRPFKVTGMGPISLFVEDVADSAQFYIDTYGFQVTEEVKSAGHSSVFLRLGTEHHTLGLLPVDLRGALGHSNESTLMACGFRVGSYRQLRDAVQFLRERGVEVTTDVPHALHPGVEYAAYAFDPSGHRVLLFCAMEQVGSDGRCRRPEDRLSLQEVWPEVLESETDTYRSQMILGPLA